MPPLVLIHVIIGYLGLLSGLIVMIMPKKGNIRHKKLGMFYFVCMTISTSLAMYLSIVHDRMFFLFIGIFTLHSLFGGFILTAKRYKKFKYLLIPLAVIGLGNGVVMVTSGSIVLIAFGSFQLLLALLDIKMLLAKNLHPLQIVKAHAGKMAGSFTAATTAFGVNVIFTGGEWWHWLLPTLIITPISTWWGIQLDKKRKALLVKIKDDSQ